MSIAFMGLFAGILAERVGPRVGIALLPLLVAAGIGSVVYWHLTEEAERGDLRPYYAVQFLPLVCLPLLVLLFPPRYTHTADLFVALGWYLLAKICEGEFDGPIFRLGHVVSGHTLKHLLAALGAGWILLMLWLRRPCSPRALLLPAGATAPGSP
jgi:hypothetical protein